MVRLRKQHIIVESPLNVDELDHKMFLLAAGADPRARTRGGETPAKLAWGTDSAPVRDLLESAALSAARP